VGKQKRQEQTVSRGKRVSIIGVWEPQSSFEYALQVGSIDGESFLAFMEEMAQQAQEKMERTGRWTVMVMDNGSCHRTIEVKKKWPKWEEQGLYCFFLPPYCSEMNLIECEWRQLKAHEIAGRMFKSEEELSQAIIKGIEHRAEQGDFKTQRFEFICA
jgi:transposase